MINDTTINCEADFPFVTDVVTKEGQPVLVQSIGQWDIRKQVIAGKSERFVLCAMRTVEVMHQKIRQRNEEVSLQGDAKQNVTSFILLVNLQGYNLRQHACFGCKFHKV